MSESEQKQIFDDWLQQHRGIFFKVVRSYAGNSADQDDLFQEIALQVWQSIPDFRGESKPSTWIYRVALFTATLLLGLSYSVVVCKRSQTFRRQCSVKLIKRCGK